MGACLYLLSNKPTQTSTTSICLFLTLIFPNIHIMVTNTSSLQVFPPSFRELPHPSLELFDLDEAFSSEKSRLAQVRLSSSIGSLRVGD